MAHVSVLILDKNFKEPGLVANVGLVLGLTAGRLLPDSTFGGEVVDGDNTRHTYLTQIGHYVREAGQAKLLALRNEFAADPEIVVIDYTDAAAPADYSAYANTLAGQKGEQIKYRAVYIYGPEEKVAPKTKNLSRA